VDHFYKIQMVEKINQMVEKIVTVKTSTSCK